ncbi:hypothetical protein [Neoaquamicrobium sediminum]|uniref:hypothetical protein n=1 Tax=Neoaquamicrobium sediminum TaxID=1849104 RepID=UPI003BAC9445
MVKVGYTEFSYGYAFTENLIRSSATAPAGAPVFPNLVQEATLGYDVNINRPGQPQFFQFKLPEHMKRSNVFELTNYVCPKLSAPFFRIALMRRDLSDQHENLRNLETAYPNAVFYVAPHLTGTHQFNNSYNKAEVAKDSVYISPRDIGPLPDDKVHTIAYKAGLNVAYFCSDPREISAKSFSDIEKTIADRLAEATAPISKTAAEVRNAVMEFATPVVRHAAVGLGARVLARAAATPPTATPDPLVAQTTADILVAREVSRVSLGLDLVFAQLG